MTELYSIFTQINDGCPKEKGSVENKGANCLSIELNLFYK